MAWDLAIDYNSFDLIPAPSNDFDSRIGEDTVQQRIRMRLRIPRESWTLDPTDGSLGSNLDEIFRMPAFRAQSEGELIVREALAPMDDIEVTNVKLTSATDERIVNLVIEYRHLQQDEPDTQLLSIAVPVS
jgi:hypothetical protein